jgi:hypothetical protein
MRSTRAKSLLIDFLFTSVPLSYGDDARSLIARRVGHDNQPSGQQTQSDKPFFPILETVVFKRDARPGKHLCGILEAQAVLGEVRSGSSPRPIRISFSNVALFVATSNLPFCQARRRRLERGGHRVPHRRRLAPGTDAGLVLRDAARSQAAVPTVHLKAFTMVEIAYLARRTKISIRETLERLREAGMDSLPGGGATRVTLHNRTARKRHRGRYTALAQTCGVQLAFASRSNALCKSPLMYV